VITVQHLGIRFYFDRHRRVVTPNAARLRRDCSTTWGVRDLSFSVSAGEGVALIGASGSGKTTTLRVLAGVYAPDEGQVLVRGRVASAGDLANVGLPCKHMSLTFNVTLVPERSMIFGLKASLIRGVHSGPSATKRLRNPRSSSAHAILLPDAAAVSSLGNG